MLRLDGEYGVDQSTMQALEGLYHRVSLGGFVIVDDYVLKPCAQAVDEFRAQPASAAPLRDADATARVVACGRDWLLTCLVNLSVRQPARRDGDDCGAAVAQRTGARPRTDHRSPMSA